MTTYTEPDRRPAGIVLLSTVYLLFGLGIGGTLVALAFLPIREEVSAQIQYFGDKLPWAIAGAILLSAAAIELAAGLWRGSKWAWALCSFMYCCSIVTSFVALVLMLMLSVVTANGRFPHMAHAIAEFSTHSVIRLLIAVLVYLYLFKANVRQFFHLTDSKALKAVMLQLALSVCVATICFVVVGFAIRQRASNTHFVSLVPSGTVSR